MSRRYNTETRATPEISRELDKVSRRAAALIRAENELWRVVTEAHDQGATWRQIAAALNVTPQAAQQRFSKPPRGRLA